MVNESDWNHEFAGLIPGLAQCVKDLPLLWLRRRPAATAQMIQPLAWEPPNAAGAAQEIANEKKKKKKEKEI